MRTPASLAIAALAFAACSDAPTAARTTPDVPDAPVAARGTDGDDFIPGRYIVVLRDDVADVPGVARAIAAANRAGIRHQYSRALKGFAVEMTAEAAARVARHPLVTRVEQDQVMRLTATQSGATWGLDRVDQRVLPLSTTYSYTNTGGGVTAYIIDTGILYGHGDFGGRASAGFDAFTDGRNGSDCNGHGTHVAGTVGGTTYGVAKGVSLVAVRVLDCNGSGSTSGVIAGVEWVTANAAKPAVANMSLGGGASTALDNAVKASIASGVTYAVAAGNGNWIGRAQDACKYSPARVPEALTVSATDKADKKASYANYGRCVDLFAPGNGITSAWYTSASATNTISGTSMASPHVAGVAALYLESNTGATPAAVGQAIVAGGTTGRVTSAGSGSPNLLLYTAY